MGCGHSSHLGVHLLCYGVHLLYAWTTLWVGVDASRHKLTKLQKVKGIHSHNHILNSITFVDSLTTTLYRTNSTTCGLFFIDTLPILVFLVNDPLPDTCGFNNRLSPPLSKCRQVREGSRTSLSSCRGSKDSSCLHRRGTGGLPSRTTGTPMTRCLI